MIYSIVVALLLIGSPQTVSWPKFDSSLANGAYRNNTLGFAYEIPDGFEVEDSPLPNPDQTTTLLRGTKASDENVKAQLWLFTSDAKDASESTLVHIERFLKNYTAQPGVELVRKAHETTVNDHSWCRADYNEEFNGLTMYKADVSTRWRGHWLDWTFTAASAKDLDALVSSIRGVTFVTEKEAESSASGGQVAQIATPPKRIRVSEGVSSGLLVKKVVAQFPADVNVKGTVVLKATIGTDGKVQNLSLVSGNPMLVASAIEAAKQYQYKPFLLNGEPLQMETEISIPFTPPNEK